MKELTTFDQIISYLNQTLGSGDRMFRMQTMYDLYKDSFTHFPAYQIAGTNGKGSVVAYLTALFHGEGKKVCAFVSPHLLIETERLLINGQPISQEQFVEIFQEVKHKIDAIQAFPIEDLSYFEWFLLLYWELISREQPDIALVEVGIGGLNDVTSIMNMTAGAIVSIGLDHQALLGNSLEEIAMQKAGIIEENEPIFTGDFTKEANIAIDYTIKAYEANLYRLHRDFDVKLIKRHEDGRTDISYKSLTGEEHTLFCPLVGDVQSENLAIALALYEHESGSDSIDWEKVRHSLTKTFWPGRLQKLREKPLVYIDGAHNIAAVQAVLAQLACPPFKGRKVTLVYAAQTHKNIDQVMDYLQKEYRDYPLIVSDIHVDRSAHEENYKAYAGQFMEQEDLIELLNKESDMIYLCFGSLYFVGDLLRAFKND